jgi:hypothetical protein
VLRFLALNFRAVMGPQKESDLIVAFFEFPEVLTVDLERDNLRLQVRDALLRRQRRPIAERGADGLQERGAPLFFGGKAPADRHRHAAVTM